MQWYVYSILAMISFSAMILAIRKIRDYGFSSMQINVFLFGVVFAGFSLIIGNELREAFDFSGFKYAAALLILASACAIIANYADFKAVGLSPNPGYSQAIKNSNILTITLFSILLFHLSFDVLKTIGVIICIVGMCVLVLNNTHNKADGKLKKYNGYPWYAYSFATVIFFTAMILILKQVTIVGFSSVQINFFLFGFSFIGFLALGWKEAAMVMKNVQMRTFLTLTVLASAFSLAGNYFDIEAIRLAPNPGYAQAIKNANILIITFFSARYMFSELSLRGVAGTMMIFGGIILLVV